ncbi:periplasmic chaperone for outer membrane proteins SurA [Pseudochrobactrum asaccharolyticum]|jgi:peptidyl-prolyl cis-trans isomerase SurA|uniref:Periplasmic chaperone for outer membrane proteins SurA n=2 Tax=Pseudochrobactrum asaccharolyticum TaxID=354351 RepID=A0A366EBI3_9HYPH|nr:periplasmic chaperone for outer membrane proteins SurA [Pseudochrobactrum asaccharolyticum]
MKLTTMSMNMNKRILAAMIAGTVAFTALSITEMTGAANAAEIKVIVNSNPITNVDIANRVAFLKLQRRSGNLNKLAQDELVEEMLKRVEMKSRGIVVSDQELETAYAGFASRNKMSVAQLNQLMNQTGITPKHFKTFIMVQMGWNRAIGARFRSEGMMSEQDAVQRMLKEGGKKPSTNEYTLQQVIFVVPAANRSAGVMAKRRQEANTLRNRFSGCDATRSLTKGMMDVTVRDLGKHLELQLPPEWTTQLKATAVGRATAVQDTDKGVEFLAVCAKRSVSDDRVAQLTFSMEGTSNNSDQEKKAEEISKKYVKELREKAKIVNR